MEGYKWMFNNQLIAVWSAPNYCYRCGNIASIMEVDEYLQSNFVTYDPAPQSERKVPSNDSPPDYFLYPVCSHSPSLAGKRAHFLNRRHFAKTHPIE